MHLAGGAAPRLTQPVDDHPEPCLRGGGLRGLAIALAAQGEEVPVDVGCLERVGGGGALLAVVLDLPLVVSLGVGGIRVLGDERLRLALRSRGRSRRSRVRRMPRHTGSAATRADRRPCAHSRRAGRGHRSRVVSCRRSRCADPRRRRGWHRPSPRTARTWRGSSWDCRGSARRSRGEWTTSVLLPAAIVGARRGHDDGENYPSSRAGRFSRRAPLRSARGRRRSRSPRRRPTAAG